MFCLNLPELIKRFSRNVSSRVYGLCFFKCLNKKTTLKWNSNASKVKRCVGLLPTFNKWERAKRDTCGQGLKKCKFSGKLVEISRGPQVDDDRPFMTS